LGEEIRQTLDRWRKEAQDPRVAMRLSPSAPGFFQELPRDLWGIDEREAMEELLESLPRPLFARLRKHLGAWLLKMPDWNDEETFAMWFRPQEGALQHVRDLGLSREVMDALGLRVVEGEHPGSTYFAAELRKPVALGPGGGLRQLGQRRGDGGPRGGLARSEEARELAARQAGVSHDHLEAVAAARAVALAILQLGAGMEEGEVRRALEAEFGYDLALETVLAGAALTSRPRTRRLARRRWRRRLRPARRRCAARCPWAATPTRWPASPAPSPRRAGQCLGRWRRARGLCCPRTSARS
jgi:hypothetical protein